LSCACALADAGIEVTLLEARKNLGGRAHSFQHKETGLLIDNCQHVLLGCCEASIGFLSRIGSIADVDFRETLDIIDEAGKVFTIRSSRLPTPFHLLPSVARTGYLSPGDKLDLCRIMAAVALRSPKKQSSAREYLTSIRCSDRLIDRLFEPIIISALNEDSGAASADYARMLLRTTLLGGRDSYKLGVPKTPISKWIEEPAARYLADRGCRIRNATKVERLNTRNDRVESVLLSSGEDLKYDFYICAVPPWSLTRLGITTEAASMLEWRPTIGAHLFFDGEIPNFDQACLIGEPFQWVFNKSQDFNTDYAYIQAVASAADGIANMGKSDLIFLALRAASRIAPETAHRKLKQALVIREIRATFSTGGSANAVRPKCATRYNNLFLAGDWTDTQWPSTIESAVRSGQTAASAVLEVTEKGWDGNQPLLSQ